jgi:hypothetical protein
MTATRRFGVPDGVRAPKYPVPSYLAAMTAQADYNSFLNNKSPNLLRKDKRRKRPCSIGATLTMYKAEVHEAVCRGNGLDPYTGDPVRWDQIHEWNSEARKRTDRSNADRHSPVLYRILLYYSHYRSFRASIGLQM